MKDVLMYENFDLETVVTPVNYNKLNQLLKEAGYDKSKRKFWVNGFKKGFSLGYENDCKVQVTSPNLPLNVGDEIDLWNNLMKEVKYKRYTGPFDQIPDQFRDDFIQSPIGLVPKDGGKDTRLIFHLSHPCKLVQGKCVSVNGNTSKDKCSVHYPDFCDPICRCLDEGIGCTLSKSDVRSAFRNLGLMPKFWCYLIMKDRNPLNGKWCYFIDKCLPFRASISCALFQKVSDALAFLVEYCTGKKVVNYLDDFLFVALLASLCNLQVCTFIDICNQINFHISLEKTCWATTLITFLGFLIDADNQIIGILGKKFRRH